MTLAIDKLRLQRGERIVLDSISARFDCGKLTAILGPNGAGKSTMLNCLAGLLQPDGGSATLDGENIAALPQRQRAKAIGLLPQLGETHWAIRAEVVVALGRYQHRRGWGIDPADRIAIDSAMAATDTVQFADRPVTTLSGGERARVLMARVLAGEPRWILADEPLANLDPGHQMDMLALLHAEAKAGRGVIAVLHDLASAARFADHVLLLHQGRIFAQGAPEDVMNSDNLRQVYGIAATTRRTPAGTLTVEIDGRA